MAEAPPASEPFPLPVPLTHCLGREQDVTALVRLLQGTRLVTLIGAGGIGKTRLALAVAEQLRPAFGDGVAFVRLAALHDPALVPATIAQVLGVAEAASIPLVQRLQASLRSKQLLLVLDNFEQILDAAPLLTALLEACPALQILVTSRAALRVDGEQLYRLGPLALPPAGAVVTLATVPQYAALALFIQRAQAVRPDFTVTADTLPTIAAICQRLDGLPLALELAAARSRVLAPQALLARLEPRLALLTDGARDAPARQQTLRTTIAWSYALLTRSQQQLFRRLAVFVGGCTLTAVEAVCDRAGSPDYDVLAGVTALVDHSLLLQQEGVDGEPRFGMLETIRAFALEQLDASGEGDATRERHARACLRLAEAAAPHLYLLGGPDAAAWFQRLLLERDNLRAALHWAQGHGEADLGMRLSGALAIFHMRVGAREGRQWAETLLALPQAAARTAARAWALYAVAVLAWLGDDLLAMQRALEECIGIAREVGELRMRFLGLAWLAQALASQGKAMAAYAAVAEALSLAQQSGRPPAEQTWVLAVRGRTALLAGDYPQAADDYAEILARYREQGASGLLVGALAGAGAVALEQGEAVAAQATFEEALRLGRAVGVPRDTVAVLSNLGYVLTQRGAWREAAPLLAEGLALSREHGDRLGQAACLRNVGLLAAQQGQLERAVQLLGAAQRQFAATGVSASLVHRAGYTDHLVAIQTRLGGPAFAAAWAVGEALTAEQASAAALVLADELAARPREPAAGPVPATPMRFPDGLTAREVEVLGRIAAGCSTHEIATALVISAGTVERHVTNLYGKIGARSRAEATAYAFRHQLVDPPSV